MELKNTEIPKKITKRFEISKSLIERIKAAKKAISKEQKNGTIQPPT